MSLWVEKRKKEIKKKKMLGRATASAAAKGELGGMWIAKCFGTDRNKHKTHTHTHTPTNSERRPHATETRQFYCNRKKSKKISWPTTWPDQKTRRSAIQANQINSQKRMSRNNQNKSFSPQIYKYIYIAGTIITSVRNFGFLIVWPCCRAGWNCLLFF